MKKYLLKLIDEDIKRLRKGLAFQEDYLERSGTLDMYHHKAVATTKNKIVKAVRFRDRVEKLK